VGVLRDETGVLGLQVLQDSLCGSSKVMLVCNLSPEAASAGETLSSLNFAARAAQVNIPMLSVVGKAM